MFKRRTGNASQKQLLKSLFFLLTGTLFFASPARGQLDTNAPWPMFGQNLGHTGTPVKNVVGIRGGPYVKWAYNTGNIVITTPAVDRDGTAYLGCYNGNLMAFRPDGSVRWVFPTGADVSGPSIGPGGIVYAGNGNSVLNAVRTNGAFLWSFTGINWTASTPVIDSGGKVYFATASGFFYAITNGSAKWTFNATGGINSSAFLSANGVFYVGDMNGGLHAVQNGSALWTYQIPGMPGEHAIQASPAIGNDGTVYFSEAGMMGGGLHAVTNGALKWFLPIGSMVYTSPAIGSDGTIYVGGIDAKLYAVNPNGTIKWIFTTGNQIYSSPVIGADGTVYFGNRDGWIYAVTNGTLRWSLGVSPGTEISSTLAIGPNGTIYVGSHNGWFYAIGERPPAPAWKSISAPSSSSIALVWTKLSNATSCTLFRNTTTNPFSALPVVVLLGIETNYLDTGLTADTTYYYWLRADFSSAPADSSVMISNTTPIGPMPPSIPVFSGISVLSGKIDIQWNKMANVLSWTLRRGFVTNSASASHLATLPFGTTNFNDTSVSNNLQYYYFVKAVNSVGSSAWSSPISEISLAISPSLGFNPSPGSIVTNGNFMIENWIPIGPGYIDGYYYRWNQMPSDTVTLSDQPWTPVFMGQTVIHTNEGVWFLHIASANQAGVLGSSSSFGPFICFKQIVKSLRVATGKNRVNPDGYDFTIISTADILSNTQPPFGPLTTPKKFYIEILAGSCNLACSGTNLGLPFVTSTPDSFSFSVSGFSVDQVKLRLWWEGDPAIESFVSFLISPEMDIEDNRDAIIYNNIVCPSAGDRIDIYLNAAINEEISVRIYDVAERRLIRSLTGIGGELEHISFDLKTESGQVLPEGTYGAVIQGNGWIKRRKFVINCGHGK